MTETTYARDDRQQRDQIPATAPQQTARLAPRDGCRRADRRPHRRRGIGCRRHADPELEAKRKKAEADAAAKQKAEEQRVAAAKAENCSRAKAQLTTLDSGIRIARANANGEREFLDDKQRADETKRTKDVISADCK